MSARTELMVASLLVAREKIARGVRELICPALPENEVQGTLRAWITSQVRVSTGHPFFIFTSYNSWMRMHYPDIAYGEDKSWRVEGRLQWIDAMIEELKKGD